jgi:hypothetical protein
LLDNMMRETVFNTESEKPSLTRSITPVQRAGVKLLIIL